MKTKPLLLLFPVIVSLLFVGTTSGQKNSLIVGNRFPVWNLNPYKVEDKESREVCDLIYAGLIGIDNALNPIPELAVGHPSLWTPVIKNKEHPELTISLKKNIKWHFQCGSGGNLFSSKDVTETFRYIRNNPGLPGASKVENIFNIIAPGTSRIQIHFNSADQVTGRNLDFKILPAALLNNKNNFRRIGTDSCTAIGTGPYRVASWDQISNRIELVYADNGFRRQAPVVRSISIGVEPNEAIRNQNLQQHVIDLVTDLPAQYSSELRNRVGVKVFNYPSVDLMAIFFNYRKSKGLGEKAKHNPNYNFFRNRQIRRLLDMAIDKKTIYESIYLDESTSYPGITGPFVPGSGAYNSAVEDFKWDDADYSSMTYERRKGEARRQLKRILKRNGIDASSLPKLELIYLESQGGNDFNAGIARSIAFQLKAALGIKISRTPKGKVDFFKALHRGEFDLALYEWSSSLNPAVSMWEPRAENENAKTLNETNFCGYDYEGSSLREYARNVQTIKYERRYPEKRMTAYHSLHKQLHDESAAIFLWNRSIYIAINDVFKDVLIKDPINFLKSVQYWGNGQS